MGRAEFLSQTRLSGGPCATRGWDKRDPMSIRTPLKSMDVQFSTELPGLRLSSMLEKNHKKRAGEAESF